MKITDFTGEKKEEDQEFYNLQSLFYKSCRIGDYKTAIIVAEKIKRMKGEYVVARTLIQLAGEDLTPSEFQRLYPLITAYIENVKEKRQRGHDLWQVVYAVAKAKKWYQTEEGRELEEVRHIVKEKELPEIKFPNWVFDWHTHEGRRRIKEGIADLRLDGRWQNRWNVKNRWEEITKDIPTYEQKVKKWIEYFYTHGGE